MDTYNLVTPADDEFQITKFGFTDIDFGPSGTLSSEKFVKDTIATKPEHRVINDAELGRVYIDRDGSDPTHPQELFAILLNNTPDLTADDFFVG